MNILIADENIDYHTHYASLLDRKHHIFFVSDGSQAIQILLKNKIDLLVTDYRMPKLNGLQILEYLSINKILISTALLISDSLPSNFELTKLKKDLNFQFNFFIAEKDDDGFDQIKLLQSK